MDSINPNIFENFKFGELEMKLYLYWIENHVGILAALPWCYIVLIVYLYLGVALSLVLRPTTKRCKFLSIWRFWRMVNNVKKRIKIRNELFTIILIYDSIKIIIVFTLRYGLQYPVTTMSFQRCIIGTNYHLRISIIYLIIIQGYW